MNKKFIILFFIIYFFNVEKSFSKTACSSGVLGLKREIPLEATPTYFIRVDTNTRKIFLSGDCTISLDTGKCITRGKTWEPYPISGSKLVTIPMCSKGKEQGNAANMCFFDQDTYKNAADSIPVYVDPIMKGYYQSLGFLNKEKTKIRLITYYGLMRDYSVKNGKVSPLGKVIEHCKGLDNKLPMLSKDGKTLSAWNLDTNKTVFYDLTDDGKCTPKFKLDYMVGKMDFDYQNKYAAFHASSDSAGKINEQSGAPAGVIQSFDDKGKLISINLNQQIFIMDLKSKKIHKLSFGLDNIYYPHFGENGLLYALKLDNVTKKYSILEINVDEALKISNTEGSVCVDCDQKKQESFFKAGCEN